MSFRKKPTDKEAAICNAAVQTVGDGMAQMFHADEREEGESKIKKGLDTLLGNMVNTSMITWDIAPSLELTSFKVSFVFWMWPPGEDSVDVYLSTGYVYTPGDALSICTDTALCILQMQRKLIKLLIETDECSGIVDGLFLLGVKVYE